MSRDLRYCERCESDTLRLFHHCIRCHRRVDTCHPHAGQTTTEYQWTRHKPRECSRMVMCGYCILHDTAQAGRLVVQQGADEEDTRTKFPFIVEYWDNFVRSRRRANSTNSRDRSRSRSRVNMLNSW